MYRESSKPMRLKIGLTPSQAVEAIRDWYTKNGGAIPESLTVQELIRPEDPHPPWDWKNDIWLELILTEKPK